MTEPLPTAEELAAISERDQIDRAFGATSMDERQIAIALNDRHDLLALVDHLQELNVSLAERCAGQSEVLSRKAEKATAYDPAFGDYRLCTCGHFYHQHCYVNQLSGCLQCRCEEFTEKGGQLDAE